MISLFSLLIDLLIKSPPLYVLLVSLLIAAFEASGLYYSSQYDGVLLIENGVGLLNNYGLITTILGNAFFPYLVRIFYDETRTLTKKPKIISSDEVRRETINLNRIFRLDGPYKNIVRLFVFIGLASWVSNLSFHLLGLSEAHWGHSVFDSPDHFSSFIANRANNFYTWVIMLPICSYVTVFSCYQLIAITKAAYQDRVLEYDLLENDGFGGFVFIEKSQTNFNIILALLYIQIAAHTGTFRMNAEHVFSYVCATIILLFGNVTFMSSIREQINNIKLLAIEECKNKIYANGSLYFNVLKYYYDSNTRRYTVINSAVKLGAIVVSTVIKSIPSVTAIYKSII